MLGWVGGGYLENRAGTELHRTLRESPISGLGREEGAEKAGAEEGAAKRQTKHWTKGRWERSKMKGEIKSSLKSRLRIHSISIVSLPGQSIQTSEWQS